MEDELPAVLDGVDEPPTVEELEAVVRRAGQRRRASLVAGAAALLALGALGGAVARGAGEDTTGFAATDAPRPPAAVPSVMNGGTPSAMSGVPLTPLFRREANGVAIRAYRTSWSADPVAKANCPPPDIVQGELSNSAAVGMATAPLQEGDTFALLGAGTFGLAEGEPVTWATVRAGVGTSTVRLRMGASTDAMAPQERLALLAVPGSAGDGVVEGLDADGKVVASQDLRDVTRLALDPGCVPQPCGPGATAGTIMGHNVPAPGQAVPLPGGGISPMPPAAQAPIQDTVVCEGAPPAPPATPAGATPGPTLPEPTGSNTPATGPTPQPAGSNAPATGPTPQPAGSNVPATGPTPQPAAATTSTVAADQAP